MLFGVIREFFLGSRLAGDVRIFRAVACPSSCILLLSDMDDIRGLWNLALVKIKSSLSQQN
jgi:hypothetical protein